ncbi:uncharacterized protein LOC113330814 [Papaver somniferum]|uniref:uncharacterized protein LOC113330814 n=1 Tax=Papaver somniferum TaxID=3469 RepID=UPI000E700D79|nr:uncharacterized protein LOC113330814 [Papaver somniferum]
MGLSLVEDNAKVLIGDGRNTSLYYDVWVGDESIAEILEDFSLDRTLPLNGGDCMVWKPSYSGKSIVSSAKNLIRKKYAKLEGTNLLWRKAIHPALAARNWKILTGACATLDKVQSRFKIQIANKCCLCNSEEETLDHLLWHCFFAEKAWKWIADIFGVHSHLQLTTVYKAARGRSGVFKELWLLTNLVVRSELWQTRNRFVYENKKLCWIFFQKSVFNQVHDYSRRLKGFMHYSVEDLKFMEFFKLAHRLVQFHEPVECKWTVPEMDELLLCCDGAAHGNP